MKLSFARYSHELVIFVFVITGFYCIFSCSLIHSTPVFENIQRQFLRRMLINKSDIFLSSILSCCEQDFLLYTFCF
jgi:hypothetical protein